MADETAEAPARKGPPPAEVRKLVERAQAGDRDALEELYLIHFDRIYSYLHMTVGNRHDAEDLTTQTFLRMLESIGKFRWQSAPFSAWLFRIAHNLSMDHFRARRRWQPEEEVPEPRRLGGALGRGRGVPVDRPQVDARDDRGPLRRAAAGADAEVRLQLLERRRGDDPRQDRGRGEEPPAPRARLAAEAAAPDVAGRARRASRLVALEVGIVGLPGVGQDDALHTR